MVKISKYHACGSIVGLMVHTVASVLGEVVREFEIANPSIQSTE